MHFEIDDMALEEEITKLRWAVRADGNVVVRATRGGNATSIVAVFTTRGDISLPMGVDERLGFNLDADRRVKLEIH